MRCPLGARVISYPTRRAWITGLVSANILFFVALLAMRQPDYPALRALDADLVSGDISSEQPIYFAARPFPMGMVVRDSVTADLYLLLNMPAMAATIFGGVELHFWLAWDWFPSWKESWHLSQSWVFTVVFVLASTFQWAVVGWLLGLRCPFEPKAPNRPLQPTSGG
jgi:hypothetical protein